jgi:hypothetical protein
MITNVSKVVLSPAELALAANPEVILTKNAVIDKVYSLFGGLASQYSQALVPDLLRREGIFDANAKISRGEKYEGMPWVMLDYPRAFNHAMGCLAIRTFFWWGHGFSIKSQFAGEWAYKAELSIKSNAGFLDTWQVGWTNDPWNLKIPNDEWVPVGQNEPAYQWLIAARCYRVDQWEIIDEIFPAAFQLLLNLFGEE